MTEQEWMNCTDPQLMLEFLRRRASERKLRLLAVACCRRNWRYITDKQPDEILDHEQAREIVEVVERVADGTSSAKQLRNARRFASVLSISNPPLEVVELASGEDALEAVREVMRSIARIICARSMERAPKAGRIASFQAERAIGTLHTAFIRDIFGPLLLRRIEIMAEQQVPTVRLLAQTIYDADRAFDRLPILADALEDAGCTNADILNHCRQPGEHVRGCWVIDLLLGKE